MPRSSTSTDLEKADAADVSRFSWRDLTVTVKDAKTKESLNILEGVSGYAKPGEMLALMGPSGSGKTTLLNVLARRPAAAAASVAGNVALNNKRFSSQTLRDISTFVEQEDALIGSLTVRETIEFAARLASQHDEKGRVGELIKAFGLEKQENTQIGTVLKKGISGGQKRRVSVASQMITRPKILFLDEPTSGLDSTAAYEVMSRIRRVAQEENMIVIASIHQPSTSTFNLFSRLLLLSQGKTVYYGDINKVGDHFAQQQLPIPLHENPAEFLLDTVNLDFQRDEQGDESVDSRVDRLVTAWAAKEQAQAAEESGHWKSPGSKKRLTNDFRQSFVLLHRLWIKSYRDILPYWIRVVMYLGLAFMMGTVWLRLGHTQTNIAPFISALFFSSAFMAFMAVAYVPAYLEDFSSYRKEHANGLYGPFAFLVSNFLIALPFMFLIALLFAIITVYLVNLQPDATSFFCNVMWLFLDLVAAESLVVLVSSIIPNFVGALAIVAFANGLFMSVGGFLVPQKVLNVFWYYTFYWIDYQRYVFQGLMWNEFDGQTYACDSMGDDRYQCMYAPIEGNPGKIDGKTVLHSLGYSKEDRGLWIGVLIAIIAGMRLITAAYLHFVKAK